MPLIQAVGATPASSSTPSISFTAITAGNFGFCAIRIGSATTVTSVVDNLGGAWTVSTVYSGGGSGAICFAYRLNCPSGVTSVTWNLSAANGAHLVFVEFSTVLTTAAIDQTSAGATGTSTSALSDSVTTASASELLVVVMAAAGTETFSQSGSWLIASGGAGGTIAPTARLAVVYQEVTATGTYAAAVTLSASLLWLARTVTFQESGGASFDPSTVPWAEPYQPPTTTSVVGF